LGRLIRVPSEIVRGQSLEDNENMFRCVSNTKNLFYGR
jgi:hypothetical protein